MSLKDFFDSIDENGSGTIDARETANALNLIDEVFLQKKMYLKHVLLNA